MTAQLSSDQHELKHYHPKHSSSDGQTSFRMVLRADTFVLPYKYDIIFKHVRQLKALGNEVIVGKFDVQDLSPPFTF